MLFLQLARRKTCKLISTEEVVAETFSRIEQVFFQFAIPHIFASGWGACEHGARFWILDGLLTFDLVTYNNENQKEDKKGQEDELSSALFPHFLFCLNSFYFFFCHVHSDNEGWKEKVLIPAIQWACDNCHRWHDPPSCSARLPSNWPRSQDPWRPHGSRGSLAPSSSYHRVWRGKRCHDEFFEFKKNYSSVNFSQF